jgi:uncharacterized protein YbjT (DUF2867 family)
LHLRISCSTVQPLSFCNQIEEVLMTRSQQIFTVVGATSDSGRVVAQRLREAGHTVRPVSRQHGVSLDDAAALRRSFEGAFGAYLMMPFDLQAPDLHTRERELCAYLGNAVGGAGLRRVVVLSGLSADLKRGSSLGAALLEETVTRLGIPELVFLRAGWFMENFIKGLNFPAQVDSGTFAAPFRPDRPMPMVSAADVGRRAADLLMADDAGDRTQELLGARSYTMEEATAVMAAACGRPDVRYQRVELPDARAGMLAAGMSESFADAVLETARSFNDNEPWGRQQRTPDSATATTLEQWASEHMGVAR